jgi:hypothetical protein
VIDWIARILLTAINSKSAGSMRKLFKNAKKTKEKGGEKTAGTGLRTGGSFLESFSLNSVKIINLVKELATFNVKYGPIIGLL